jgi:pimeloyl-ACP methyl ester carboxylesterase
LGRPLARLKTPPLYSVLRDSLDALRIGELIVNTVTSNDGTTIAFDQSGTGPALILVGGMFEQRAMDSETAQLAAFPLLAEHFTIFHYDRRGRGDSADTLPYAVEREIEDIEALIDTAGCQAFVFGISSGAALALEAALALGGKVQKLAMYEAPYNDDAGARQAWKEFRKQLKELLAAGRHGDAVALFIMLTGASADQIDGIHQHPMWPMWEAIAPTIAYDAAAVGEDASVPTERAANLAVPALIMDGSETYPFMHVSAVALANAIPHSQHRTLEGQTHEVAADAIAPVLVEFFK